MKSFFRILLVLACTVGVSTVSSAETNTAPTPEQQAMMEQVKQRTTPGAQHKIFESLAGDWTYTAKFWMTPGSKAEETTGKSKQDVIYGGRFLRQSIEGLWMGKPFHGKGFIGYDLVRGEYTSVWFDDMATGIMTETGQYDEGSKTLRLSGNNSCPMTGEKSKAVRTEWTLSDTQRNTYRSYMTGPDGKEFLGMEIVYTRSA